MPYPQKNLNADETIALDMHPHWWYFAEPAFALAAAIIAAIVLLLETKSGSNGRSISASSCWCCSWAARSGSSGAI